MTAPRSGTVARVLERMEEVKQEALLIGDQIADCRSRQVLAPKRFLLFFFFPLNEKGRFMEFRRWGFGAGLRDLLALKFSNLMQVIYDFDLLRMDCCKYRLVHAFLEFWFEF